jgi:L-fuculose-phosphate aldolase
MHLPNLSPLRSGNISLRGKEDDKEGYLITPSGKKYETLKAEDIVFMGLNEELRDTSNQNPSSEWRFHRDIYLNKKEAQAIVHAHSPHATAVSSHGKTIPPFHYMIALAGGEDIKCADYATFGTEELSNNVIKALEKRSACLMSNHGQVAFGKNLEDAFELAQEVENICHQYTIALKLGKPKILSFEEMKKVLEKAKNYKKE